jgi:hypothetical protein
MFWDVVLQNLGCNRENIFIWIPIDDYNLYALSVIQLKTVATVVCILAILVGAERLNNKVNGLINRVIFF